jgi:uncharacterized protein YqeY
MSNLTKQINADKIAAMKSGDKSRKDALTLVQAAIKQAEVDMRKELTEVEVIQILSKMVKQRMDSITQFAAAGRTELVAIEESEKAVITQYIPTQMSEEEIRAKVKEIVEWGDNIGMAMGKAKTVFAGKADMGLVSKIVKEVLQG